MVITQERHLYGYNLAVYSAEYPYKSDRIVVEASQGFEKFGNAYVYYKDFMDEETFLKEFNRLTYDAFVDIDAQDSDGLSTLDIIDNVAAIENCNIKLYCLDNHFYEDLGKPVEYLCIIKNIDNNTYFIWKYDSFARSNLSEQSIALNVPMTITITDYWPALIGRCDFTFGVDEYYTTLYVFDSDHPFKDFDHMKDQCVKSYDEAQLLTDVRNGPQAGIFQNVFYIKPVFKGFELDLRNTVRSRLLDRQANILNEIADVTSVSDS